MAYLYWKTPYPPENLQTLPHPYFPQSRSAKAGYSKKSLMALGFRLAN